jgi:dGTP triphosphohydrolase
VSASDVEDGKIELNEENSIFNVTEQLGTQNIEYKIMDIDNNVTKGILKVTQEAVQESSEETTNEKTTETTSEKTTETTSEEATETTSEEATETTSEEISDTHNIATSEETSIYENVTKTGDSNKMIRCLLIVAIVSALVVFIQNIAKNKGE